jgi:DHA1 family putative efflux transporter-like MFS transporter
LQGFCIAFNVASVAAIVPAIAADFGVSSFIVGRINWAYMLPYGLVALVYGPLTRLFDNKHIAFVSLLLFSVFSFLSGCAVNASQLFLFRFCVGVFAAATTPLVLIYIADKAQDHQRGKYVGLFFSATFVADLIGLFLSGLIPWRLMFFIPCGLGLVAAVLTLKYFPHTLQGKGLTRSRYLEALKRPEIFKVFAYIFLVSLLYHGVRQWLGVYFAQELGFKQLLVSWVLTVSSLAAIFGEAIGGHFADKKGRVVTLKAGLCLMVISCVLLIVVRSYAGLAVLMLLWGFGWTMNHAGLSTFLTDLDKNFMKEISSLNSSVRFISGGLGVVVGGMILQKSFIMGFVIYGACLLALFLTTEKILLKREEYPLPDRL